MPPKGRQVRRDQDVSLSDAFLAMSASLGKQAREPNILAYKPHHKQQLFHKMDDHIRLYIGGNRSGKSFGSVAEDIWWATHTHPYMKTPDGPIRGRVVGVDLMQGVNQILLPIFARLMTPSMLVNGSWEDSYSKSERILNFSNGSFIEFLSYEMDTEKFAGTSRHFIHYDEEPPKHIYDECQARLIDTDGRAWIAMTPVKGMTWVHEKLFEPTEKAFDKIEIIPSTFSTGAVFRSPSTEVAVIEVSMNENPYISEKARDRFLKTLDDDERAAREKGHFITVGGKVFKSFDPAKHVISPILSPAETLKNWQWYSSTDSGWNNPTAWLWHAVSPEGTVITFGEHYQAQMTVEDHAKIVHAKEKEFGREPEMRTGDPAMKQTTPQSGTSVLQEYADHGLYIAVDSVPRSVDIGIQLMQQYFKVDPNDPESKPKWFITENCVNFIREMGKLSWEQYASRKMQDTRNRKETIHKKDDHAFDSARYFATFLPDLAPDAALIVPVEIARGGGILAYDTALNMAIDNAKENADNSMWTVVETYN
jgi:phage terminase large subunit-like protein